MRSARILPPTYFLIALIAMVTLHLALPVARVVGWLWNLVGIAPLVFGIAVNIISDRAFKTAGTTVKPFKESSALVTTGVYRISRHPMYLGLTSILVGFAFLLGSATPFLVVPLFALLDLKFIRVEERQLAERFGDEWEAYRRRVRRWL